MEKKITELAVRFRGAIDKAKASGEFDRDFSFCHFPRGCCGDASDLLGEYLLENEIESFYVCGNRCFDNPEDGIQSHAWLLVNELIVDITGDQFSDRASYYNYAESIYVGHGDEFHDLFSVEDKNVRKTVPLINLGDYCYPRLKGLYKNIKKYL